MKLKNATTARAKHWLDFTVTAISKKDASGECIIEGYANTSTKDRVGDVVLPSAFEKSLPTYLKNPIILANHDWNDPCGKALEARITDKGLYIKARISDTRADIKTLINEGCLSTFSIGYNEVDADFDDQTNTKYVKELELLEISVVTVPANTEASFTLAQAKTEEPTAEKPAEDAAKSAPIRTAKQLKDFIDVVKSAAGNELTGTQVIAICDYFNNTKDEIMTREQLIAALKAKSAVLPTTASAADAAKKDDAAPAESQSADPAEFMKQVMAKLDAIGQALAQMMEAKPAEEKPAEDKPADEGKTDAAPDAEKEKPVEEKPAEEAAEGSEDDEEMTDEERQKQIAELTVAIQELEDSSNA